MRRAPSRRSGLLLGGALGLALLVPASPAQARDATVTSFDGTPIVTHFFPAQGLGAGERAPTIMIGHGWGGSGATSAPKQYAENYNVLTWDARGFGGSGGTVMIDHPEFEARDAQALIDFIAAQPEARLDSSGDPRVGMDGGSYGGAIQFLTAALDHRVDAIAPTIAWHSLNRALYRSEVVKSGWDLILVGAGIPTSLLPGVLSPAGIQAGHQSDFFYDAVTTGLSTGQLSPEFQQWLREHGPGFLLDRIEAPTLIAQGTVDTLFTLDEAHDNYLALKGTGVPLRMMWFCGGHAACLTESDAGGAAVLGDSKLVQERKLAWFDRYLRGDRGVDTGPAFEWIDEEGTWRASDAYPPRDDGSVSATGKGILPLEPGAQPGSGVLIFATRSTPSIDVPVEVPADRNVLGAPRLHLEYTATGTSTRPDGKAAIFAQLVDEKRGVVVNNLATPIPIELDGKPHALDLPLERIASRTTNAGYTLQLIPQTSVYDLQRATGVVDVKNARIQLPLAESVRADAGGCNRIAGKRGTDRLRGTGGDDCLRGRGGADRISGRGGDDELRGGRGRDRLRGGTGSDVIRAARGSRDRIDCGPGRDTAFVSAKKDRWRRCEKVRRR